MYNFEQQGWQCPICKRVYSPFTPSCFACGGEEMTTTSISTGYATYSAEDIRTCDNCRNMSGLPSENGTRFYSGACRKCVAKDMWEPKKNE